jgi:tetraacyldisaccharide 4'-kinase
MTITKQISRIENLDILFIDDGFQHKSLHRDLDLLVVDSLSTEKEWALMPKGRLRESIGAAQRADVLLVSRANLVDQNAWPKSLRDVAAEFSKRKKPVVKINFEISGFTSGSEGAKVDDIKNEVVLLSGIGRPRSFELLIATKKKYLKHYVFADHFNYKTADVAQMLMDHPNCSIITTQKDFVKIKKLDLDLKRVFVAELGTTWLGDASAVEGLLLKGVQK